MQVHCLAETIPVIILLTQHHPIRLQAFITVDHLILLLHYIVHLLSLPAAIFHLLIIPAIRVHIAAILISRQHLIQFIRGIKN